LISPDAEIVELETAGFGRLSEVLSHRVYATKHEIHVLHRSGEVLNVVDTKDGVIDKYRESFEDASARADEIRRDSKVDRVILVDNDLAPALQTEIVELSRGINTQTELLWTAHESFFAHASVAVAPELPPSPWPKIFNGLKSLGSDYWAVVGTWKDDELFLSLIGRFESGVLTKLYSADRLSVRPGRSEAMNLVEEVEAWGPVKLALLCDMEDLERSLEKEDPLMELVRIKDNLIFEKGIREVANV
jgi:hypothetical protein